MERRRAISGAAAIVGGQILGQALAVVRNVILARLLAPESFGIATTLGLVSTFLETISYLAVDRLLVQSKRGDSPDFLGTAHTLQLIRGLILGLLVLFAAWPLARYFDASEFLGAYVLVSAIPVIRGFSHLQANIQQRTLRFGGTVAIDLVGQIAACIAAALIAPFNRTPMAFAIVLVVQAGASLATSFVVAECPYRFNWNRAVAGEFAAFGWPLVINGGLMFAISEGDRFIIGPRYGNAALGWYGAAYTLSFGATAALSKVASSIGLPLLSAKQDDLDAFTRRYAALAGTMSCLAVILAVGVVVGGHAAIRIVYGESFDPAGPLLIALGIMQAMRLMRQAPTLAALSRADSKTSLVSNMIRVGGVGAAILVARAEWPLVWIPGVGLAAELLAGLVSVYLARRRHRLPTRFTLVPSGYLLVAIAVAFLASDQLRAVDPVLQLLLAALASIASTLAIGALQPAVRRETQVIITKLKARLNLRSQHTPRAPN